MNEDVNQLKVVLVKQLERNMYNLLNAINNAYIPELFSQMIKNYKKNQNLFHYAQCHLGLARFLDYQLNVDDISQKKDFLLQVNKVAKLSWKILHIYQNICGKHEDGACVVSNLVYARVSSPMNYNTWPELPFAHALSFNSPVKPVVLKERESIYRIHDGNVKGAWWMRSRPNNKREWRSDYAVLKKWNKGTQCSEFKLTEDINVWEGGTAAQAVWSSDTNCYLQGGGVQIYLDPDDLEDHAIQAVNWQP